MVGIMRVGPALACVVACTHLQVLGRCLPHADKPCLQPASEHSKRADQAGAGLPARVLDDNWQRPDSQRRAEDAALTRSQLQEPPPDVRARIQQQAPDMADVGGLEDWIANVQIAPEAMTPWRNSKEWNTQYPLKNLGQEDYDGLWAEALVLGTKLRDTLVKIIRAGKNRVSNQQNIGEHYTESVSPELSGNDFGEVVEMFGAAQSDTTGEEIFAVSVESSIPASSQTPENQVPVLVYAVDEHTGGIVYLEGFAKNDGNTRENILRSSELLYQSYTKQLKQFSDDKSAGPTTDAFGNTPSSGSSHDGSSNSEDEIPDPRNLDCVMIHHIINQEVNNLLTLAHLRHPENVGIWRDRGPGPTAGHAVWKPDNPDDPQTDQGDVYLRLLSSPTVRTIVHMLSDHVEDLENNFITEIHTFPQVLPRPDFPNYENRKSHIVLKLGRPDWLSSAASNTRVETS